MKVILCDIQKPLTSAWTELFKNTRNVEVFCGDIFSCGKAEGLVSAANSFGFMDGGIDWVYTKKFGPKLQADLQTEISKRPMKELLVGEALVVPTGHEDYPYLISAPTMRVPSDVSTTLNAYLAFKAALLTAKANRFESLLCPGLGTSAGKMDGEVCAKQMFQAYNNVILKSDVFPARLVDAGRKHYQLGGATWYV